MYRRNRTSWKGKNQRELSDVTLIQDQEPRKILPGCVLSSERIRATAATHLDRQRAIARDATSLINPILKIKKTSRYACAIA